MARCNSPISRPGSSTRWMYRLTPSWRLCDPRSRCWARNAQRAGVIICPPRDDERRMRSGQVLRAAAPHSPQRQDAPSAIAEFRSVRRRCRPRARNQILPDLDLPGDHSSWGLIRPDFEADQCIGTERLGDRDIGSIAPLPEQDTADPRHIVPRVEHLPSPADIGLEPAGKISHGPRLRRADIAEISGAVAGRNIHAAAESNGEVGIVAADTFALIVDLPRRHGGAGVLIAERDVAMNEITDRLHARPARLRVLEQLPRDVGN